MATSNVRFPPIADIGRLARVGALRRIVIWNEAEVTGLASAWGLSRILTEVDEQGTVTRELGYDLDGNVVHRHPGEPTRAKHGVFDLAKIASSDTTDMEPVEFDRLWSA